MGERRPGWVAGKLDGVLSRLVRAAVLVSAGCTAAVLFGAGLFLGLRDGFGTVVASGIFAAVFFVAAIVALAVRAGIRRGIKAQDARIAAGLARWRKRVVSRADRLERKVQRRVVAGGRRVVAGGRTAAAATSRAFKPVARSVRGSVETRPWTTLVLLFAAGAALGAVSRRARG